MSDNKKQKLTLNFTRV